MGLAFAQPIQCVINIAKGVGLCNRLNIMQGCKIKHLLDGGGAAHRRAGDLPLSEY